MGPEQERDLCTLQKKREKKGLEIGCTTSKDGYSAEKK